MFPRDFDANLYLCEEAFGLLPFNTFGRLSDTLLFYAYVFVLSITVTVAFVVAFHNLRYGIFQKSNALLLMNLFHVAEKLHS